MRKKFAIVFIIIIAMSIALLFYYNKEDSNERTIAGCKYEYTYFDRKLTVDDFRQFGYDSTYEEIVEAVGEENGNIGSGLYIPYYELRGGKYAIIHFSSNVRRIDIANRFKVLYSLLPAKEWVEPFPLKESDEPLGEYSKAELEKYLDEDLQVEFDYQFEAYEKLNGEPLFQRIEIYQNDMKIGEGMVTWNGNVWNYGGSCFNHLYLHSFNAAN